MRVAERAEETAFLYQYRQSGWPGHPRRETVASAVRCIVSEINPLCNRNCPKSGSPIPILNSLGLSSSPQFSGSMRPNSFHSGEAYARHDDGDRKSTRLNSSHLGISYAVFCLKKKTESTK